MIGEIKSAKFFTEYKVRAFGKPFHCIALHLFSLIEWHPRKLFLCMAMWIALPVGQNFNNTVK